MYTLYNSDCLHVLPDLNIATAVMITDPPYGINENSKKNASREQMAKPKDYGVYDWDTERNTAFIPYALQAKTAVIFGGNYYTDLLPPSAAWVVWDKLNSGDFADCEMIYTNAAGAARMYRYLWNGMIKQRPEIRYHPTQKPLDLMVWLVERYTEPGDLVVDPFMGSGTTGVACQLTNRHFIGIEQNETYYNTAETRIANAAGKFKRTVDELERGQLSFFD